MQNFDEDRARRAATDRAFQIGGETFTAKAAVRPEIMGTYETIDEGMDSADVLRIVDGLIESMIADPNGVSRWRALRESDLDGNPLNQSDILALCAWLLEAATGRPTQPSGPSTNGSATPGTGTNSTDTSPSPVGGTFG